MHSASRPHEPEPDLPSCVRGCLWNLNEDFGSCNCQQEARNTRQIMNEYGSTLPDRQQSCPAQKRPCRFKLLHV